MSLEETAKRLTAFADEIIESCNTFIAGAEQAAFDPPLDIEPFRVARMHALRVKRAVANREQIPREWFDAITAAWEEGCRQR